VAGVIPAKMGSEPALRKNRVLRGVGAQKGKFFFDKKWSSSPPQDHPTGANMQGGALWRHPSGAFFSFFDPSKTAIFTLFSGCLFREWHTVC